MSYLKALYIEVPGVDRAKSSRTELEGETEPIEDNDSAATADKGVVILFDAVVENINDDDFVLVKCNK